jgi:hypothetical protein
LEFDEEALYAQLGAYLVGEPGQVRGEKLDDLIARGRNWMERHRKELADRVCGDPVVREAALQKVQDLGAVADAIAGISGDPPAYTVAAILLGWGIETLCGGVDTS